MASSTSASQPRNRRAVSMALAVLGAIALAVAAPAQASTDYMLLDDPTRTQISGDQTGLRSSFLGTFGDYFGIWEINMWEKADHACKINAKSRHFNTLRNTIASDELRQACNNDRQTVGYTDTNTYVRGVQVCLSRSGKIKGVRIYGARLNRNTGQLSNVADKQFDRPNCRGNWRTPVYCPVGKIASVVEPYRHGDNFVALGLQCRTLVPQPTHPQH